MIKYVYFPSYVKKVRIEIVYRFQAYAYFSLISCVQAATRQQGPIVLVFVAKQRGYGRLAITDCLQL